MKRVEQLQFLSKEHHQSLVLASKCKKIVANETVEFVKAFCLQLKNDFDTQWVTHFKTEESRIFSVAVGKGGEIAELSQRLIKEHRLLEELLEKIVDGEYQQLTVFGQLLHDHTRLEERVLFPLVEELFSQQELASIEGK